MKEMEQLLAAAVLSIVVTGVMSLQCYQCHINPPAGKTYTTTERLCATFDGSSKFVIECPHSTFCMKQDIRLDILNGVRVDATLRDCAPQTNSFLDYRNGQWFRKEEILEPYQEGCEELDGGGQRTTPTRFCYCKSNLCNAAPATNHEGYTDIMGVIVVFNLMKYINSLR